MSRTLPFDEAAVLYRFTPTEEEQSQEVEKAEEYAVIRNTNPNFHALRFYARFGEDWLEDEFGADIVIARLLADLKALQEYVKKPGGLTYAELAKENDLLAKDREDYRLALEAIAKDWAQPARNTARKVLNLDD